MSDFWKYYEPEPSRPAPVREDWGPGPHEVHSLPPAAPTVQEPVAFALRHRNGLEFNSNYPMVNTLEKAEDLKRRHFGAVEIAYLYTTPPAAPVQEPVGEVCGYYERGFDAEKTRYGKLYNQDLPLGIKLYTTPPAANRPWFGLTDEEIIKATENIAGRKNIARAIEAKLKEKNT